MSSKSKILQAFLDVSKERLAPKLFDGIMAEATERAKNIQRVYDDSRSNRLAEPEIMEEIQKLAGKGSSVSNVAKAIGRSRTWTFHVMKAAGLTTPPRRWSQEELQKIESMRDDGLTLKQISEDLGLNYNTLHSAVRKNEVNRLSSLKR